MKSPKNDDRSKPQALTDAGVGRALFTTRFRLSLQAAIMCLTIGALPGFALPYLAWFGLASGQTVDLVRLNALSSVLPEKTPRKWRIRDEDGERCIVEFQTADHRFIQWMTPPQVRKVLGEKLSHAQLGFDLVALFSLVTAAMGFDLTLRFLRRLGQGSQENQRVRGASLLVSGPELSSLVKKNGGGPYTLADVLLPKDAPVRGISVQGTTGGGKTVAIVDLMFQVFDKLKKCIIYDPTGEFFKAFYRPGKDLFFNPGLEGSVPWSIFSELRYKFDADTLARAVLPPKDGVAAGAGGFFEDAARSLFSVILLRMGLRGARYTHELAEMILSGSPEAIDILVANSVASSAVAGDSKGQRQGVLSSLAIYMSGLAAVQPGEWSIRDFLDGPEDSRLFIVGTKDTLAQNAPLYRLLLTVAFLAIEAKAEVVRDDRYWFLLDECHTLGDIRLDEQLATLRKFGVAIVSAMQSESQFVTSMGKDRATTVSNCFNTVLLLGAGNADMQRASAMRLGELEMDTVSRNQALAVTEWRDGAGLNKSERDKWLVMPAEFGQLAPCTGYLKLSGPYPAAKVDYRDWFNPSATGEIRANRFKAVQPMAPRDERFLVVRPPANDWKGRLKEEIKAGKAQVAAPGETGVPGPTVAGAQASGERSTPIRFGDANTPGAGPQRPQQPQQPQQLKLHLVPKPPAPGEPPDEIDPVQGQEKGLAPDAAQEQAPQSEAAAKAENNAEQAQKPEQGQVLELGIDLTRLGHMYDHDRHPGRDFSI